MGQRNKGGGLPPRHPGPRQSSLSAPEASSSTGRPNLTSERRKHATSKRPNSAEETQKKHDQFYSIWEPLTQEKKNKFLLIRIQELRDYLSTSFKKDSVLILQIFDEAIAFGKANQNQNQNQVNWRFWVCSHCSEKFTDDETHVDHVIKRHGKQKRLAREIHPSPPQWINMVFNGTWRPVDVPAALQFIEVHNDSPDNGPRKVMVPLSDLGDERAPLLEKIRDMFKQLLRTGCFPMTNLLTIIGLLREDLQLVFPRSKHAFLDRIADSGLCIRFLDVHQLKELLKILYLLADDCDSVTFPDNDGSLEKSLSRLKGITIQEKIGFNGDLSCLVLDERLMQPFQIMPHRYLPQRVSISNYQVDDAFIDWLLFSAPVCEEIDLWGRLKTDKKNLGMMFLKAFDLASERLYSWGEESIKHSAVKQTLHEVQGICNREDELRKNDQMHTPVDFQSLIQRHYSQNRVYLETRGSILREAQTLDVTEFESRKAWAWMRTWLPDVKGNHELQRKDGSIKITLHKRLNQVSIERCKVDSKLLKLNNLQKIMLDRFKQASTLDYRAILLPFVKSFLQENVEKLIREDAEKKANEAAEALLKELALEEKSKKRGSDVKNLQKKFKLKKKKSMEN